MVLRNNLTVWVHFDSGPTVFGRNGRLSHMVCTVFKWLGDIRAGVGEVSRCDDSEYRLRQENRTFRCRNLSGCEFPPRAPNSPDGKVSLLPVSPTSQMVSDEQSRTDSSSENKTNFFCPCIP